MLIDWFTVGAQLLNFLILAWLLKRFLYRPILNALDAREERIAAELASADAKKVEALRERDEFRSKNDAFDQQRAAMLSQAAEEVKAERQRLLDQAREAVDTLRAHGMQSLARDTHNLQQAIRRRTGQEVFAIARKALADLATTSLEERAGEVFMGRLRDLNDEERGRFASALKSAGGSAVIRSAFKLPEAQRAAIQNTLNETFAAEVRVTFETAPDLITGIELSTNGQKIAWSIAHYLTSLEEGVAELVNAQVMAEGTAEPEVEAGVHEAEGVVPDADEPRGRKREGHEQGA